MAKRVEYVDIAKALAIFLVVIGHIVDVHTTTKIFIYSFHMPLFFLLSGFFLRLPGKFSCHEVFTFGMKKVQSLVVPFILWGLIYSSLSYKNIALVLYGSRESLYAAGSLSSLWFLSALFISMMYCHIILSLVNKADSPFVRVIIATILVVIAFFIPRISPYGLPWEIDVAFVGAAFLLLGSVMKAPIEKLSSRSTWVLLSVLICSICILVMTCGLNHPSSGYVYFANGIYGNMIFFIITSLVGSIATITLAILISKITLIVTCLVSIGKKTLGILLVHKPLTAIGRSAAGMLSLDYNYWPISLLIAVVVMTISIMIVCIIEHFCPFLLGKTKFGGNHD